MAVGERSTEALGKCETHPGRPAVGQCEHCGRALCLVCAVPVRERILGPECLPEVLGTETSVESDAVRLVRSGWLALVALGFLVATTASILPWTHSSFGSGLFGAWQASPLTWSLLSAMAALVGLVVSGLLLLRPSTLPRAGPPLLAGLGLVAALGAVLHVVRPPQFTAPWLGPWVAMGGAALAFLAAVATGRAWRAHPGVFDSGGSTALNR